jgi:hypothetical protein
MLPLIYNMKSRMPYTSLLPNRIQVCQLDLPFQPANETWAAAAVEQSSLTSVFGLSGDARLSLPANVYVDGMLRSLLTAARQPSVEDSLGDAGWAHACGLWITTALRQYTPRPLTAISTVHILEMIIMKFSAGNAMMKSRRERIASNR